MRIGLLVMWLVTWPAFGWAQGTPALERLLADEDPCGSLPALSDLDFIRIDRLHLSAEGDRMTAEVAGGLGCRTPGNGLLATTISADITAFVSVRLPDCEPLDTEVTLSNIGGSAAALLDLLRTDAERALRGVFSDLAEDACRALLEM
jgi:hypothetical protein